MDKQVDAYVWEAERIADAVPVPDYLERIYWWTYNRSWAVWVFDRQWVVNAILLTQYNRMRRAVLAALGEILPGRTLQISCAYGDLTPKLAMRVAKGGGILDLVDVLPIQLENARAKLPSGAPVRLINMNAEALALPADRYDRVMIYFLLHEVPKDVRAKVLKEAFRVLKPGGRLVMGEFSNPKWWNPFRYLWAVFLSIFEPFALDMWRTDIADMLPDAARGCRMDRNRYFGGLFQRTVVTKE